MNFYDYQSCFNAANEFTVPLSTTAAALRPSKRIPRFEGGTGFLLRDIVDARLG